MSSTRCSKLISFATVLAAACAQATTYYVSPAGDDSRDGLTRETAWKDVTTAIMNADAGDTVFMLNGTHVFTNKAEIIFPKRITLCGEDRDLTILDNQNQGGMIKSQSQGGKASAGTVYHSFTLTRFGSAYAGSLGITAAGSATYTTIVSNMVFRQNGNAFSGNARYPLQVTDFGHISHCYFTNNIAPNNCAVSIAGRTVMENCYVADSKSKGSTANWYGVVSIGDDRCVFRNNTVVNNKCDKGAVFLSCANPQVYNNIIWGNTYYSSTADNNVYVNGKSTANCKGNCCYPLLGTTENGNTASDPLLAEDQKHFAKSSPCNGHAFAYAESNWYPEFDLEYSPRPSAPSIGAFEYVASSKLTVKVTASDTSAIKPATISLGAEPDGNYTEPLTYAWDFDGDGITDSTEAAPVLSDIGVYIPSVAITDAGGKTATDTYPNRVIIYSNTGKVYVTSRENLNAKPPYATPETAATNLCQAVEFALKDSFVELDDGVHYVDSTITISRDFTIKSKYGPDVTYLAKRSGSKQLFIINTSGAVIDGFTVENQNFENYAQGAAIAADGGKVINCRFIRNKVTGHGQVTATAGGAGPLFENLVFIGNTASGSQGPAGTKLNGAGTLRNCLFYANTNKVSGTDSTYWGGAIHGAGNQNALIENCTIVSNVSWNAGDAGIYSGWKVRNTINAFNLRKVGEEYVDSNNVTTNQLTFSCVYPVTDDFSLCKGVITDDPVFVSAELGNLHLKKLSPCVNAGTNFVYTAESKDLDGNPRIYEFGGKHSQVDLGCYESSYAFKRGLKVLLK